MNADGSGQRPLTNARASGFARASSGSPGRDNAPTFSPDGKKIAFTSNRDGNYEIYVMNADGSGQTRVTNDPAGNFAEDWGSYPASNPQPNPQPLTVTAARIPKACTSRAFRTRVRISTSAPLKSVRVFLDGRRIAKSRRHSFTVRVPVRRLRAGRHRLTVKAVDTAGNRTRRTFRFRVCRTRRPRFLH